MRMKWLEKYHCWVFDDGRVATPSKTGLTFRKPWKDKGGYTRVSLNQEYASNAQVHRLLALAFLPNPNDLPTVDHIDRNKNNNTLTNLRWCSYSDNALNKSATDDCIRKYGVSSNDPLYTHFYYKTNKSLLDDKLRKWREKNRDRYNEYMRQYHRSRRSKAND